MTKQNPAGKGILEESTLNEKTRIVGAYQAQRKRRKALEQMKALCCAAPVDDDARQDLRVIEKIFHAQAFIRTVGAGPGSEG